MTPGVSVLFLHGGPGLTAEMERRCYGRRLPVYWWDQPTVPLQSPRPLEVLLDAAEGQVRKLSETLAGPIGLLASSFGARLVGPLLQRVPERVRAVTICGGVLNAKRAFIQLGRHLARTLADPSLADASQRAADSERPELVWALIAAINSKPGFIDAYWTEAGAESKETMKALIAEGSLLHMETFQTVVDAELSRAPGGLSEAVLADRVRILIGRSDPYVEEDAMTAWRTAFPRATVQLVEAGHFPHLELQPELWLPH